MSMGERALGRAWWAGLALATLMLLADIASTDREVAWTSSSRGTIAIANGAAMLFRVPQDTFPDGGYSRGFMSRPYGGHLHWAPAWQPGPGGRVIVPLCMPLLLIAAPTAWMWRLSRQSERASRAGGASRPGIA